MQLSNSKSVTKELFRYARVYSPKIIDLPYRLRKYGLSGINKDSEKEEVAGSLLKEWARKFARSGDYVKADDKTGFNLFENLNIRDVPDDFLPDKSVIKDKDKLRKSLKKSAQEYKETLEKITISLYAASLNNDRHEVNRLSRLLSFAEMLPVLEKTERKQRYAPPVAIRHNEKRKIVAKDKKEIISRDNYRKEITEASVQILSIWDAVNEWHNKQLKDLEHEIIEVSRKKFVSDLTPLPVVKKMTAKKNEHADDDSRETGKDDPEERKSLKAGRSKEYKEFISGKNETLRTLRIKKNELKNYSLNQKINSLAKDEKFNQEYAEKYGKNLASVIEKLPDEYKNTSSFCELYTKTKNYHKIPGYSSQNQVSCLTKPGNPCFDELSKDMYSIEGNDDIRPLGIANLVTVEESWMKYTPGEIGYVENILKGEVRKKKVKRTNYFEQIAETISREEEEKQEESSSSATQELSSAVESEINTRFNSDINASVSGSGGGSIGVVELSGGASLGAGIGIGTDSSISISDESNFSQEIISKAVEKTKKATSERRVARSYSKFETVDFHKIDNTAPEAKHTNAIYCYLDKHICITEKVYGIRKFLVAELMDPGMQLIKDQVNKYVLNLNEVGLPPYFDLSPDDINPENYLSLVGKFRATNVSTPPPAIKIISRTYKTDTTNENREQNEISLKKISKVLAPAFGEYKRFLIQDNIEIPEGYMVKEVLVTVTHGSNGVSIPAHLPLSLLGAAVFALPTIGAASIPPYTLFYLPMAIWQVVVTASPVLHFNSDSSNVTINIGHQTEESPYFFFQPDFMIREILDALGNSDLLSQTFLDFLRAKIEELYNNVTSPANNEIINSLSGLTTEMVNSVNTFITSLQNWLKDLVINIIPAIISGGGASAPSFPPLPSVSPETLAAIPEAIVAPFRDFFNAIVDFVEVQLQGSLGELFEYFISILDNTDTKLFTGFSGYPGTLPVSFNCIALKPGITINLSVCMARIDEMALDSWKIETYERLNQAYYQLEADYRSRTVMARSNQLMKSSPGLMREEEQQVLKERIIRALHKKYSSSPDIPVTIDELKLFENAVDWKNISYRLFNYGPKGIHVAFEKMGLYDTADERRRSFMKSSWTQILIPLNEDSRLEQVMLNYIETGSVDFEADLLARIDGSEPLNELTVIYRDLILQREQLPLMDPVYRNEIIPTDLRVIYTEQDGKPFPVNETGCTA